MLHVYHSAAPNVVGHYEGVYLDEAAPWRADLFDALRSLRCHLEARQWSGRSVSQADLEGSARSYLAARGYKHSLAESLEASGAIHRLTRSIHSNYVRERAITQLNYIGQCIANGVTSANIKNLSPGPVYQEALLLQIGDRAVAALHEAEKGAAAWGPPSSCGPIRYNQPKVSLVAQLEDLGSPPKPTYTLQRIRRIETPKKYKVKGA